MLLWEQANFSNAMFVDDNVVWARAHLAFQALQQSVIAAHLLFGYPHKDRRYSSIPHLKWDMRISLVMLYLGFEICTCRMIVAWPSLKRLALQSELTTLLSARRPMCTSRMAASLFGKIRSALQTGVLRLLYRVPPCCPPRQL
jgi:hypothetical protein